jgi:hypothetical protein
MIRIVGFQSRELRIAFTQTAVTWNCNIIHSLVQSALECGSENSLARRQLSEISGDEYHTLAG